MRRNCWRPPSPTTPRPPTTPGQFANSFAQLTEGLSLRRLFAIAQLAEEQRLPLAEVGDAVRCFKVGELDNPWKKAYLRERIQNAPEKSASGSRASNRRSSKPWISSCAR